MPQLNPAPWLLTLLLSWTVLLMILQTKTLAVSAQNSPTTQDTLTYKNPSWNWPWI